MSRYRKLDPRIWNDAKFRTLTDDGKLAFLFTLTHPGMTSLGAMRGSLAGLAAELGWRPLRFQKAIAQCIKLGMVEYDSVAAFVALPNFLRYNEPEGPNSVKAWTGALDLIPECAGKQELLARCRTYLHARSAEFQRAIPHAIWDAIADATPDAMPDAIADPGAGAVTGAGAGAGEAPPNPPHAGGSCGNSSTPTDVACEWLQALNREAERDFPANPSTLKPIRARIADGHTLAEAEQVVAYKTAEWRGTRYAAFLRPSTVFGAEFDAYLQAALHACDPASDAGRGGLVDEWKDRPVGEVINGRVVPFFGLRGPSPPAEEPR